MGSHTTVDMIDEPIQQLNQLLQDVQERDQSVSQRDETDSEFQGRGNDDHVAPVTLDSESFIEF